MTLNRIAIALSALLFLATGIVALQGTPPAAVAPPRPIPTESPAPDTPWQRAELRTTDGLEQAILTPGSGNVPVEGQLVDVSATWWVESMKRRVDHLDHELFLLGSTPPIDAIGVVAATMRPGETRQVRVPPELGYGQTGKLPTVPRSAPLILEITLHSAKDMRSPAAAPPAVAFDQRDGDLQYAVIAPGSGPAPAPGAMVHIHLTMWSDGLLSGSTLYSGRPLSMQLGSGKVLPEVEQMMTQMRVGERRVLRIPPPPSSQNPPSAGPGLRIAEIERVADGT